MWQLGSAVSMQHAHRLQEDAVEEGKSGSVGRWNGPIVREKN